MLILWPFSMSLPGQLPRLPCRRGRLHCCSCWGWRLLGQILIPVGASGVHHPKVTLPEGAEWPSTMKLENEDGLLHDPCPQYKDCLDLSRWAKLSSHFGGYIWQHLGGNHGLSDFLSIRLKRRKLDSANCWHENQIWWCKKEPQKNSEKHNKNILMCFRPTHIYTMSTKYQYFNFYIIQCGTEEEKQTYDCAFHLLCFEFVII